MSAYTVKKIVLFFGGVFFVIFLFLTIIGQKTIGHWPLLIMLLGLAGLLALLSLYNYFAKK